MILAKKTTTIIIRKGGSGSGYHDHPGRPGLVGGSSSTRPQYDFQPTTPADQILLRHIDQKASQVLSDGIKSNDSLVMLSSRAPWMYYDPDVRGKVKSEIVAEIATRSGVDEETVNNMLESWADTSNNSMRSLSFQDAIEEEFGVKMSDWQREKLTNIKVRVKNERDAVLDNVATSAKYVEEMQKQLDEIKANHPNNTEAIEYQQHIVESSKNFMIDYTYTIGMHDKGIESPDPDRLMTDKKYAKEWAARYIEDSYPEFAKFDDTESRKVARAIYSYTQEKLAARVDENDNVLLFRGFQNDKSSYNVGDEVDYKGNAIESWSLSSGVARGFGNTILGAYVPRKSIFATARTGLGCIIEGEYIIFGTLPNNRVRIMEAY